MAQKEGVNIKKEVVEESDSLAKSIIGYAKKSDMDVIVIGTKGMTAVEDFFLEASLIMSFAMFRMIVFNKSF